MYPAGVMKRVTVVGLVVLPLLVSSCAKVGPKGGRVSGLAAGTTITPTKYTVSTTQELIDVFDDNTSPVLQDGDTVYVEPGTYTVANDTLSQYGAKSLYFIGAADTMPILEKTGNGVFFNLHDTSPGTKSLEIRNLKFDCNESWAYNYRRISMHNVVSNYWNVISDTLDVDGCAFSDRQTILKHVSREGVAAYHAVKNSSFAQVDQASSSVLFGISNHANMTTEYVNNTFTYERTDTPNGACAMLFSGTGSEYGHLILEDNDFDNGQVSFDGVNMYTVVDYDGNTQDLSTCAEDVVVGQYPPDVLNISTWLHDGDTYSYDDFGDVTESESSFWTVCTLGSDETVYVRFDVAGSHAYDNENIISVVVEYGTSTSYGDSVSAAWCGDESEWQAAFPATSGTMYWRARATICEKTHLGPAKSMKRPKSPYLCVPPAWYCFQ